MGRAIDSQHVHSGVQYPPLLITAGMNDPRAFQNTESQRLNPGSQRSSST